MHILIGLITAIAGLFWAINSLQRSGFNPASLNPFLWNRRRKWKNLYSQKPIYNLDKPLDVAALLLLGTLKCEGEISSEQKAVLTSIYKENFNLNSSEASDLLLASSHLIRDEIYLADNIDNILEKSHQQYSEDQINALLALMDKVSTIESTTNQEQDNLINAVKNYFNKSTHSNGQW